MVLYKQTKDRGLVLSQFGEVVRSANTDTNVPGVYLGDMAPAGLAVYWPHEGCCFAKGGTSLRDIA
jgi:hypothetical protein